MTVSPRVRSVLATLAFLLIAGCVAGPDFKRPAAPDVGDFTASPLGTTASVPLLAGGEAQRFARGSDIPGDWWTLFHSRPLDQLIELALANNHDLGAARAALAAARETVLAQRGAYFPTVAAGFSASRQRQSEVIAPAPNANVFQYSLFTPQLSITYAPDVFGLNRRRVESVEAQEQAVRFQMIAAYLTLTSNVAAAAIEDASLRAQIDATRQLIEIDTKAVKILKYQFSRGYADRLDVAAQQTQLAQAAATLPALIKQSAQQRHLLAVLCGRFPSRAPPEDIELSSLKLPEELPVSLPSALVAQRPDVLQAEANLHIANAQVGIAVANRLPNIQLTANAGATALAIGQVFSSGTGFWGLAASVTAPLIDGGALRHQERAARAAWVQAAEQYRGTVLTAFQNVADALTAIDEDARGLKQAAAAADAATVTLELSQRRWRDGYVGYLSLLSAEQAARQTRISLAQAQASRFADTAALFQALGGGWWRRADLARDSDEH